MKIILHAFIPAFILAYILSTVFKFVAWRLNIVDYPDNAKTHKEPTPLLGGMAIYSAFMVIIFFLVRNPLYNSLYLAATMVFILGLIDDIRPLPAVARLLVQVIAVALMINGGISFTFFPNTVMGRIGEILLTLLWMVGMVNAFNCLDGLNGLLSGIAIINTAFFFIFTKLTGQYALGFVLMVFAGACTGFFPHNFLKGKIFMGNAGSMWIGFILAGLAIIGNWAEDNPLDLIIPILIFGVPIFDMIYTTIIRFGNKKVKNVAELLDYKGKDHFHHQLARIGLGDKGAVLFVFLTCILLGLNGLLLSLSSNLLMALIIMCICSIFFVLISLLMKVSFYQ